MGEFDAEGFLKLWLAKKPIKQYAKGWSPERAAQQRQRCLTNKPWQHSTGARTPEGKAISCMNARKHGLYDSAYLELQREARRILYELAENESEYRNVTN